MRISLTRTIRFRATHRLGKPSWSDAENRARFGTAADEHGHHYACAVTVTGPVDPATDTVVDLPTLDRVLHREVSGRLEGKALHRELPEFAAGRSQSTCEALARDLFARIAAGLPPGVALERVQVAEDDTLHAECCGP
jgi:6-pyruvoyltetrahydropterin/6-carboxytetrahydropterin synthase